VYTIKRRMPCIVLSSTLLAMSLGCGGRSYLRNAKAENAPGVAHYFVPRDIIEVELTATENHSKGWSRTENQASPAYCKADSARRAVLKQVGVELTTRTVADTRRRFTLQLQPSSFASSKLALTTTSDGLLTGFGTSTTDERAEFVGSVIKIVAGVAGTVMGVDALRPVSLAYVSSLKGLIANDTMTLVKAALSRARDRGEYCAIGNVGGALANVLLERDVLESQIAEVRNARHAYMAEYKTARDANSLKVVQSVEELFGGRQAALESRLKAVTEQIASTVIQFKQAEGITVRDTIRKANAVIDASAFPDWTSKSAAASDAEIENELKSHPQVLELFKGTGLILTAVAINTEAALTVIPPTSNEKLKCDSSTYEAKDCVVLYTRYARPIRLEVRGRARTGSPVVSMHSRLIDVISANDALLPVAIPTSVVSSKETKVLFSRPGVVAGIDNERTGSAKDAAATLAAAIAAGRTEFTAGLESVKSAQTSLVAIESAQRTKRIQELTDQKLLLEADLALAGASSNKQLVADKQRIDAELALLTAQQSLGVQQAGGATSAELATLKAELERLKLQLELTKLQLELEKAKQSKSS
jgi:hypothetical protein